MPVLVFVGKVLKQQTSIFRRTAWPSGTQIAIRQRHITVRSQFLCPLWLCRTFCTYILIGEVLS
jgi:hypothetical protein